MGDGFDIVLSDDASLDDRVALQAARLRHVVGETVDTPRGYRELTVQKRLGLDA